MRAGQWVYAGHKLSGVCRRLHTHIADAERKSLYTLFLESVQSRLRSREESPTDTVTEQQANKRSLIKMQSIVAKHLEIDDVHDPLLAINFAR